MADQSGNNAETDLSNNENNNETNEGNSGGDSECESNDEPVVGNVNKFAVVPPGYQGPPKRGHVVFDACFEGGNLGRVDYITEYEVDIFIRPDTCNSRFRVWFNFTTENVKADQRMIFNIVNFSKTKSLYRDGMSPIVKSTSRPKWVRIPPKHVYYYRCPDHRKNYVMSFAFCFDREDDVYQFSYSYPYSYSRLQTYLDGIEKKMLPHFRRDLLGLSVQQRRLDLLTITNPDNLRSGENQRVVFITARVHPGETPSSFVCQGFIDFIVSNHPIARTLREHVVFKIVPMLNPDGVYLGNYRCSLMGFDLNRHWQEPSPWAHPTLFACKNLLVQLDKSNEHYVDFFIDIHAHSTMMNGFMYGNMYDDEARHERQSIFPKLFQQNAEDFSMVNTNFNRDPVKAGTGRRTLGGVLDVKANCYTLEVSFFSYMTNTSSAALPYTEEGYAKLGRNLARTFFDYYKFVEVISLKPTSELTPKLYPVNRDSRSNAGNNSISFSKEESQGDNSYGQNFDYKILDKPPPPAPQLCIEGCQFPSAIHYSRPHEAANAQNSELASWNINGGLRSFNESQVLNLTGYKLNSECHREAGISANTGHDYYTNINEFSFLDDDGQMSMDEMSDMSE